MNRSTLLSLAVLLLASVAHAGYTTSVDVYLAMETDAANGTIWEFSSAINTAEDVAGECAHRRDFIFTCGFYNDSDDTGDGPRYVCSASNNSVGWPKNPNRDPMTLYDTGWYVFEHDFYDDGTGVLAVDMNVYDSDGELQHSWTLSDPSDVIGMTVGGNRYGWFVVVGCTAVSGGSCSELDPGYTLPVDRTQKCTAFGCDFEQGFEVDLEGWFGEPYLMERVASGTDGVPSSSGDWHAVASAVNRAWQEPVSGDWYYVFTRWGGYNCTFGAGAADIDLRPGTEENHINTNAKQQVPIAILGTEAFIPCIAVDLDSVDVRGASPSSTRYSCQDVDGDGWEDMLLLFRARDLDKPSAEECADPAATILLTGVLSVDDMPFSGTDHVTWLGPDCK